MTALAIGDAKAPGLLRRMASLLYEGLLLFGIGLIPGALGALLVAMIGPESAAHDSRALQAVTFLIYGAYFTWFWSRRGQTLPMQTWHIRVVSSDGAPLSLQQAAGRFIAACLWVAPAATLAAVNHWDRWQALGAVGVGIVVYALSSLLHPQHQFWHDAICGTRLIDDRPSRQA
ncbi:MAG: RDD family protein [Rhizobacter sp.]|nr:RDD family protein [Rhizobacter sp.]